MRFQFRTSAASQQTLGFPGLTACGVAVDSAGDVFATDLSGNRVVELSAGGAVTTLPFTGLKSPTGLTFERDSEFASPGFLYIADAGNNRIVREVVGFADQLIGRTTLVVT